MSRAMDVAVEVSGKVAEQNQFTLYEDYKHSDKDNNEFFFSEDHIDRLAEADVKHIGLEYSPEFQPQLDAMAAVGRGKAEGKNYNPKDIDNYVDRYAQHMSKHCGINGMEPGSKEELDAYRAEARGIIRAAENGMKVHAIDTAPGAAGTHGDLEKRCAVDGQIAENIANIAGDEKMAIYYGAGHTSGKDGTAGKDMEEHLCEKGSVGRVGLAPDAKDFNDATMEGNREIPNTLICTDRSLLGMDIPGHQVQAMQAKKDGQFLPLGGEVSLANPGDDARAEYANITKKDLGKLSPPSAANQEYMQQRAQEQSNSASK